MVVCIDTSAMLGMFGRAAPLMEMRHALLARQARDAILRVSPTFRFHLIGADADDDKFADCAIAAEADYIVTEDRHFDALRGSGYKPQPVTPEEFIRGHLRGE